MSHIDPVSLIQRLDQEFKNGLKTEEVKPHDREGVLAIIEDLDQGRRRVCEKINGEWQVHEWLKKAILMYFRLQSMSVMEAGSFSYYDKIPVKRWNGTEGVRAVPHAIARKGSFVEKGAILMPSYVNIGAHVGAGTMVDTWATVGSCAQVGANVHLSGGVGLGGVLEPVQARPVIIEDNAFLGSRSIVVEGVLVEEGAVLGAGVILTASTKIIDVTSKEARVHVGRVPKNSVVIPGTTPKEFAAGTYGVPCALIIGQRKASTDLKTSLTEALRDHQVSV
ncbi:MAG: 2,3,4,5-tetrahydropyridine-2,6-dicarboxylate N-succinyltransferase [Bdellovibrionaceae bacterium]|nr:2,3,4,5-tetrahydropyridine-2,6-dicarboxylate N-succinyltransferase [Pseudobdellovibrionaceae bacterium]